MRRPPPAQAAARAAAAREGRTVSGRRENDQHQHHHHQQQQQQREDFSAPAAVAAAVRGSTRTAAERFSFSLHSDQLLTLCCTRDRHFPRLPPATYGSSRFGIIIIVCTPCCLWFNAGLPPRVLSFLPGAQGHVLPATTHVAGAHLYQEPCTALVKLSINNFSLGLTEGLTIGLTGISSNSSSSSNIRGLKGLKHYIRREYRDNLQQQQQQMRASQMSGGKVRRGS